MNYIINKLLNVVTIVFFSCLLLGTQVFSQTSNFKYKICVDSIALKTKNYSLFLLGEYHVQDGNFKVSLSYYDYLDSIGLFPKYIINEWAPSFGYLLNKYLETGDEFVLYLADDNLNQRQLYRDYRAFYMSLPDDKKFKYVGTDVERLFYATHYAVKDILLQSSIYCNYPLYSDYPVAVDNCTSERYICQVIESFKMKKNPLTWDNKYLKEDLDQIRYYLKSKDSVIFKSSLTPELYDDLLQIMKSYEISKKRKRVFMQNENNAFQVEREKFMTNQIYRLFVKDTSAIVYGQFGIDHVLLSTYKKHPKPHENIRLAIALNSDKHYPLTNNKVCSNIIYYDYLKPKYYKFLQSDLKNIKKKFNEMKNCQLLISSFENKSKTTNLILFKTK